MANPNDYDDIPGTIVFDASRSREGYHLNSFFRSLSKRENREAFRRDQPAYLLKYSMTDAQRAAVLRRDWNAMLELGANIFFMIKLAFSDGLSVQKLAARMTGMSDSEYARMMREGGRKVDGNRSKSDWADG